MAAPSQSAASSYSNELSASTSNREQAVLSNFRSLFAPYRNDRGAANSSCFSTLQKASRPSTSRRTNRHVPYRIKETWTHEFICLENPDQKVVPSRNQKLNLQTAGLGRKKIVFGNKDDALKFKNTIESVFPKLASGGGFEILRSGSNNYLILIPVPSLGLIFCSIPSRSFWIGSSFSLHSPITSSSGPRLQSRAVFNKILGAQSGRT